MGRPHYKGMYKLVKEQNDQLLMRIIELEAELSKSLFLRIWEAVKNIFTTGSV